MKFFILILMIVMLGACSHIKLNVQYVTRENLGTMEFTQGAYFFDEGSIFIKAHFESNKNNSKIDSLSMIRELNLYSRDFPNGFYVYLHPDSTVYFIINGVEESEKDEVIKIIFDRFQIIEINGSLTEEEFQNFWGIINGIIIEGLWMESKPEPNKLPPRVGGI